MPLEGSRALARCSGLVVIGASQGGLTAIETLLEGIGPSFPLPIVIAQHRSALSSESMLCGAIQRRSPLPVSEPCDKEQIAPGRIYVAPADYHLLVDPDGLALSTEGPISYARPSIDALFSSAADQFGPSLIGVILTGANFDGARGAADLKARGGYLIVQAVQTAEAAAMPRAAIAATTPDEILPPNKIGSALLRRAALQKGSILCP